MRGCLIHASPLNWVGHSRPPSHERIDALAVLLVQVCLKLRKFLIPEAWRGHACDENQYHFLVLNLILCFHRLATHKDYPTSTLLPLLITEGGIEDHHRLIPTRIEKEMNMINHSQFLPAALTSDSRQGLSEHRRIRLRIILPSPPLQPALTNIHLRKYLIDETIPQLNCDDTSEPYPSRRRTMAIAAAQTDILLADKLFTPLNTFLGTATGLKDATGWAAARVELEHMDFCCNMVAKFHLEISEVNNEVVQHECSSVRTFGQVGGARNNARDVVHRNRC